MFQRSSDMSPTYHDVDLSDGAFAKMQLPFLRRDLVPVEDVQFDGDAYRALINYSRKAPQIIHKGIGLYLYGDGGVGKSYALSCLAYDLRKRGVSVLRVTAQRAMESLTMEDRFVFSENETVAERMRSTHVLFIDGLGTEFASNKSTFSADKFLDMLAFRKQQPFAVTWFTSSLSPMGTHSEFRRRYSDALCDFMPEVAVPFKVEGRNHRKETSLSMRAELL